jgi:Uri superfamily endonuclease
MVNTEFYKNAKIYKIVDNTNGNIYVGSTCKKLCQRIAQHRASYKNYLNGKYHFVTSYKILENDDYDIILLEEVKDCENKEQLRARERHYIESLDCVNKVVPCRTKQEHYQTFKESYQKYKQDNKDKIKTYNAQYREKNKEKLSMMKKQIYDCECGSHCTYDGKARHFRTKMHQEYLKKEQQNNFNKEN